MSSVSVAILNMQDGHYSRAGRRNARIAEINEALAAYGKGDDERPALCHAGHFVPFDDGPFTKCGGDGMYYGVFNYLNDKELFAYLKSLKWDDPRNVQLFTKWESEDRFKVWQLDRDGPLE